MKKNSELHFRLILYSHQSNKKYVYQRDEVLQYTLISLVLYHYLISIKYLFTQYDVVSNIVHSMPMISLQVLLQMQSSLRRRNAHNNSLVSPMIQLPEVHEETDRDKERKIRKLSQINRELIQTLKKQNDDLSKKINKQKLRELTKKTNHSVQHENTSQKTKKELANAYKQIEMYKSVLQNLKAKEISSESADKLRAIQNSIKHQDSIIQQLQQELKYVKNTKEQQEKQLKIYQNQDVKASVNELQKQLKELKEKLKIVKKQNQKIQEEEKKQHQYCIELEKVLRKHNGQYYPGKSQKQSKEEIQEVSERQWQILRAQLNQLKKNHQAYNNRIQLLCRQKNNQIKSWQQNQLALKEKQRKLATLKTKLAEVKKLLSYKQKIAQKSEQNKQEYGDNYQMVIRDGKKVYQLKNPQKQREAKKWNIPQGYCLQKGKILPNSTFFSDKPVLRECARSKITSVRVWCDALGGVSLAQFLYCTEDKKVLEGILPMYPQEQEKTVEWTEGDYLAKIKGKFFKQHIVSLTFVSKFGKVTDFNEKAEGQQFTLQPRPNQIPSCVFGACTKNDDDQIKMCHIGCQFTVDW